MNERLRAIAAGCYKTGPLGRDGWPEYTTFDEAKFAEAIIEEYEKLLPEICPWSGADADGPMKGWHVQFVARKHFGVE